MRLTKGILLVFEGIDGTGKTTQAQILFDKLVSCGLETVYFREPSKGEWGQEIKRKAEHPDSLTPEEELDLFQKDRLENVRKNLRPALAEKKVIVLDRYYFSTIAYQGAKGIDQQRIQRMNEAFAVAPDLVFILDIDPEQGLNRISKRKKKDLLFEREDYLREVRKIFQSLRGDNIIHLDATLSQEDLAEKIETAVFDLLKPHMVS
jgi:dTMP kinase